MKLARLVSNGFYGDGEFWQPDYEYLEEEELDVYCSTIEWSSEEFDNLLF